MKMNLTISPVPMPVFSAPLHSWSESISGEAQVGISNRNAYRVATLAAGESILSAWRNVKTWPKRTNTRASWTLINLAGSNPAALKSSLPLNRQNDPAGEAGRSGDNAVCVNQHRSAGGVITDLQSFSALLVIVTMLVAAPNLFGREAVRDALPESKVAEIVGAIFRIEGGDKTRYPYGIKSINTHGDKEKAKRICENTVRNNYKRWIKAGAKVDYLDYLANVYCPPSADPQGNRNWKKNIRALVK